MRLTAVTLSLVLCLAGSLAVAQGGAPVPVPVPEPRINRNPVFREGLPPAPQPPASPRDTLPPAAGPCDPRDSTTRPVQPAASIDNRSQVPGESPATGTTAARLSSPTTTDCK